MTLLEELKKLRDDACTGNIMCRNLGICGNIMNYPYPLTLIMEHSQSWPQTSGFISYPIGGDKEFNKGELWTGESLNKRLSLINHIINEIEGIV